MLFLAINNKVAEQSSHLIPIAAPPSLLLSLRCRRLVPDTTTNAADPLPASCCRTTTNAAVPLIPPPRLTRRHVMECLLLAAGERFDKAIVDNWERRRMVKGNSRPGRGRDERAKNDDPSTATTDASPIVEVQRGSCLRVGAV